MRSTRVWFAVLVLANVAPAVITAQGVTSGNSAPSTPSVAADTTPWPNHPGCTLSADTAVLRRTLPLDVLAGLEKMSSSVFVQAFLISFVADDSAGNHRVSQCARGFLKASLKDVPTLRSSYPDAGSIIAALRTAENARLRTVQLADSVKTLDGLVARLQSDTSSGSLEALRKELDRFLPAGNCKLPGALCGILQAQRAAVDSTLFARRTTETLAEEARQARQAVGDADKQISAVQSRHTTDSLQFSRLDSAAKAAGTQPTAPAVLDTLKQKLTQWAVVLDSIRGARAKLQAHADTALTGERSAEGAAAVLLQRLQRQAVSLKNAVAAAGEGQVTVPLATSAQLAGGLPISLAAPPAATAAGSAATAAPSIVAELTNFIVARAEREAVNAFIINLHDVAANEALLQTSFPNTWGLMKGLAKRADGALDAVAVGRIPLAVWRATLASDFAALPVSLLQAGPSGLCGSAATTSDTTVRKLAEAAFSGCAQRAAVLAPLAPFALRLLEGDPVLDVLRDAETFVPASAPQLPVQWRRVAEGVSVVASLAQAYTVQGYVRSADPGQYPYILSPRALSQVAVQQRDALERLLIVHAIGTKADLPLGIDPARLAEAISNGTQALERIATRVAASDTARASAASVVHSTFDAIIAATDLASALADQSDAQWIKSVQTDWREAAGIVEPLAARDFGLAFSRVTILVRDVRGIDVPASVLTFAGLGSALAEAQTGDQVRLAFENAASPVGGWQAKRYGEGGVSINSFPGLVAGSEYLIRSPGDPSEIASFKTTAGVTLPVGIEWLSTTNHLASAASGDSCVVCNWGIFIPIIDLGAPLSYRIGSSEGVDPGANATLAQVFAPGVYLDLPLTRSVPLNFLLGGQLEPSLRRLTKVSTSPNRSAIRLGAMLTMDVQLFKF